MRRGERTFWPNNKEDQHTCYSHVFELLYSHHGRKSRGTGGGGEFTRIWSEGGANANCPRFCHVSKFQTPYCMHYNAVMQ